MATAPVGERAAAKTRAGTDRPPPAPVGPPRRWGRRAGGAAAPVGPPRRWGRRAGGAAAPVGPPRRWGRRAAAETRAGTYRAPPAGGPRRPPRLASRPMS